MIEIKTAIYWAQKTNKKKPKKKDKYQDLSQHYSQDQYQDWGNKNKTKIAIVLVLLCSSLDSKIKNYSQKKIK